MAARQRTYRGIFAKVDGTEIGLDFYAENLAFARDHAAQVAGHIGLHVEHGPLTVVRVATVDRDEFRSDRAGSWFPVVR